MAVRPVVVATRVEVDAVMPELVAGKEPAVSPRGSGGITVAVAQSGTPIYLPDVTADPRYIAISPSARSELCVPLKVGDHVIGVLNTESHRPDAFAIADQHLFQTLAHVTAVALENARLHRAMAD